MLGIVICASLAVQPSAAFNPYMPGVHNSELLGESSICHKEDATCTKEHCGQDAQALQKTYDAICISPSSSRTSSSHHVKYQKDSHAEEGYISFNDPAAYNIIVWRYEDMFFECGTIEQDRTLSEYIQKEYIPHLVLRAHWPVVMQISVKTLILIEVSLVLCLRGSMQIFEKTLAGTLDVEATDTLDDVKATVQDKEDILPDDDIQKESIIQLVLRAYRTAVMQIFVTTLVGKTTTLDVAASDTMDNVKTRVQDKKDIPSDHRCLIYACTQLEEGRISLAYDIQQESNLHVAPRLCGGMPYFVETLTAKIIIFEVEALDQFDNVKANVQTKSTSHQIIRASR